MLSLTLKLKNLPSTFYFIAISIISLLISVANRNYMLDDAYIFFTYAENILNLGQWTFDGVNVSNSATSPLYTMLLALTSFSFLVNVEQGSIILNSVIWFFLGGGTYWILNSFIEEKLPSFLLSLSILTLPFLSIMYRMESQLTLVLLVCMIFFYMQGRYVLMGLVGGLAYLSRPDSLLLLVIVFAYMFITGKFRKLAIAIISFVITVLPWLLFSAFTFGSVFPSTLSAKMDQGASGLWPVLFLPGLIRTASDIFMNQGAMLISLCTLLFIAIINWKYFIPLIKLKNNQANQLNDRKSHVRGFLTAFVFVYTIIYGLVFKVPYDYGWYYSPIIYFIPILIFSFYAKSPYFVKIMVLTFTVLAILTNVQQNPVLQFQSLETPGRVQDYKSIGEFIRRNTPENSTVGFFEVGVLAWFSKRPMIDSLGLDDPELSSKVSTRELGYWLREKQPDYFLLPQQEWAFSQPTLYCQWTSVPWFNIAYEVYNEFTPATDQTYFEYRLFKKVMTADDAIKQTSIVGPPSVSFGLDVLSDPYVFGIDPFWAKKINNPDYVYMVVPSILPYYNVQKIGKNKYRTLSDEDPQIVIPKPQHGLDIVGSAHPNIDKWFVKLTLSAWPSHHQPNRIPETPGQLFIGTKTTSFVENPQNFRVLLDGKPHTYYIPIFKDTEKWLPIIDVQILRLDPIASSGEFEILGIELAGFIGEMNKVR